MDNTSERSRAFWERLEKSLKRIGIDPDQLARAGDSLQCVVVTPEKLRDCLDDLARTTRDQVVMVRLDGPTTSKLDAWVETDAVKSRSEAAALFIREGLKVYEPELAKLEGALADVDSAKWRLAERVKEVFGGKPDPDEKA